MTWFVCGFSCHHEWFSVCGNQLHFWHDEMALHSSGCSHFVFCLSIFRRPYYTSWFLPALLRPRVVSTFFFLCILLSSLFVGRWLAPNLPAFLLQLPKSPDARMAFIDSLKRYWGSPVLSFWASDGWKLYTLFTKRCLLANPFGRAAWPDLFVACRMWKEQLFCVDKRLQFCN